MLRRYYHWALREKRVLADPTARLLAARQPPRLPKTLTQQQVENLLRVPDDGTPLGLRDRAMLELMYASGLRVSELVALTLLQISPLEQVLLITGKGNKERILYLNDGCKAALESYLTVRAMLSLQHEPALFVSNRRTRITRAGVHKMVKKYLLTAGLDASKYSAHKLRHTAATLMLQNGVDVKAVQEVLGHEHLNTTEIYTHIDNEALRVAAKANPLSRLKPPKKNETEK